MIIIGSGYFYAGLELDNDLVIRAAPILKYMEGWTTEQVRNYKNKKGWKAWILS